MDRKVLRRPSYAWPINRRWNLALPSFFSHRLVFHLKCQLAMTMFPARGILCIVSATRDLVCPQATEGKDSSWDS